MDQTLTIIMIVVAVIIVVSIGILFAAIRRKRPVNSSECAELKERCIKDLEACGYNIDMSEPIYGVENYDWWTKNLGENYESLLKNEYKRHDGRMKEILKTVGEGSPGYNKDKLRHLTHGETVIHVEKLLNMAIPLLEPGDGRPGWRYDDYRDMPTSDSNLSWYSQSHLE